MSDNNRKKVDVTQVTENGQKKWKCKYKGTDGGAEICPKIKLDEDTGAHEIVFSVEAGSPKFASANPIWVQRGTKPTVSQLDAQIVAVKPRDNGQELAVLDWNDEKVDLYYRLNFEDGTYIDPIIENGGGTNIIDPQGFTGAQPGGAMAAESRPALDFGSSGFWILFAMIVAASIIARLVLRLFKL